MAIAASQSPQYMLCVFWFRVFYEERRGEVSTDRPPANKSPFLLDDKSKRNKPFITRTNLLTLTLYMSHSSSSFDYRCVAVNAIHVVCVFVRRVFYKFPCREAVQLICLAALRFS